MIDRVVPMRNSDLPRGYSEKYNYFFYQEIKLLRTD